METKIDNIMGLVLTEKEKERQASNIRLSPDLINGLLGEEKINLQEFGSSYMGLKYIDYEELKKIRENFSEDEKNKIPSMGIDMGVFKNNQNEYISVYDVNDIKMKTVELAEEKISRIGENLIHGNKEVLQSEKTIDNLTIHFKSAERFGKRDLFFDGKKGIEFLNKIIETDNIYSKERTEDNSKNSESLYKPYYKTNLGLQYSGLYYDLERIDIGDGVYKNIKEFVVERERNFEKISTELEKLNAFIPQKIIDEFKGNYDKLFKEMKEYIPEKQKFKTSEEAFNEIEKILENKDREQKEIDLGKESKKLEEEKRNPWKKQNSNEKDKER